MSPRNTTGIRSGTTTTAVAYSRAELERILRRYGCRRFGSDTDHEAGTIRVWFTVPDEKGEAGEAASYIPVRLEVRLSEVRAKLDRGRRGQTPVEQVERVAWRHVVLLVEAGLLAAESGIKRVSEFFLADTLVQNGQGRPVRFLEALEGREPGWKGLLTAGGQAE